MKSFKDTQGRDWTIQVNYSAKERVEALTKLNLFDITVFEKLGDDPAKLIDVLYAVCKEQTDKLGLSKPQFVDAISGDAIEQAADALTQEIIDFFPQRRREILKKILATAEQVQDKALNLIDQKLQSGELLKKLEERLNEGSGGSPESSASTPGPLPSASST